MSKFPLVSVIIPVFNEEKDIGEAILSLKKQSYKNFEIIIIDDGSTDKTLEIIGSFKDISIINGEHKGPGFSRNIGARNAKGEILIFVDADMTFDKNYIKNLILPLIKNKTLIGTTHDFEYVKNDSNIWSRCWGKIRVSKENAKDVKIFRSIRKNKFTGFGGFDPRYGYADDQTFWFKYKIKPVVANETICFHKNPETLKSVYKQSRWIGSSLDFKLFQFYFIREILILSLIFFSPILIFFLSIKRVLVIKDFKVFFPYMLIFSTARYFGTLEGIIRNIYFKINFR